MENNDRGLAEAEALAAMLDSSGWQIAKRELNDMLAVAKDITKLDLSKGDLEQQVRDNIKLCQTIELWLTALEARVRNARRVADAVAATDPHVTRL